MTAMEPTTAHANGHARPVTLTPMPVSTPVSALPQDDPGQSRTAVDKPGRWRDAMSAFRRNWWRLVFATVGAVAAVVSYGHIVNLFLSWHAPSLDAHLMPIAIDGLIIIGAGAARSGQVWLGWSAIGPGLAASLYANVMNGLPYGRDAAMGSGWATVALFLATNVMERWKPAGAAADVTASTVNDVTGGAAGQPGKDGGEGLAGSLPVRAAAVAAPPVTPAVTPARGDRPPPGKVLTRQERAAVIRDHPGLTNAALAALCGCDTRTIQRDKNSTGA